MHSLLKRQLRRFFGEQLPSTDRFDEFLRAVSDAYAAFDDDRTVLEHSLALASKEVEERFQALQRDVVEREKMRAQRDAFFRASPDMLSVMRADMKLVLANPSWSRVLGYESAALEGLNVLETIHPEDAQRIHATAQQMLQQASAADAQETVHELEFRQRRRDGDWRLISAAATVDPKRQVFFVVGRDVTAQRAMAREFEQTHRLEAVGQLAAGMAHEINTPIQYVGDNVVFAADGFEAVVRFLDQLINSAAPGQREQLEKEAKEADLDYLREEIPRSLNEAKDGVRRIAELVRALKEFAHPDHAEKSHADINKALERAVVMSRGELRHVAKVETHFGPLPPVRCHIGSLSQVFLNLLVNAAHAIEERTEKHGVPMSQHKVTVATRVDGNEVVVSISDTGCGIPDTIRERIFEPFFTTKPMGKGSGQGLPLVRNVIIGKHSGRIEIESEVNKGTTFVLRLPLDSPSQLGRAA